MRATVLALVALTVEPGLIAAITDLVASPDGKTLWFQARTAPTVTQTFVVRDGAPPALADFSPKDAATPTGAVLATDYYAPRVCGSAGSTCFLAPNCQAGLTVRDTRPQPASDVLTSSQRTSFVRLDPTGTYAWIEQADPADCRGLNPLTGASRNGLYTVDGATRLAPRDNALLANRRPGRRAITNTGRALTFAGEVQLQWIVPNAQPITIRHVASAFEAVTDATGRNVVYTEADFPSRLHWLDFSTDAVGRDTALDLTGSAPALTPDGTTLVYLTTENALAAWRNPTQTHRTLSTEAITTFTLSDTQAFAATPDNRILRIDLTTGEATTLVGRFPEITAIDVPELGIRFNSCAIYCYGTPDPGYILSPGMLLRIRGSNLDRGAWSLSLEGAPDTPPFTSNDPNLAYVQIPNAARLGNTQKLSISHPTLPVSTETVVQVQPAVAVCLGTLHQSFDRVVSATDPAVRGEIIHIFLTGLQGTERIPDGQPNPTDRLIPVLTPPATLPGWEPTFFGLAPGLIGIQQLDLIVGPQPPAAQTLFPGINQKYCGIPPVASRLTPATPGDIH